ncbi:MAG: class I SAM-dependent methyltransferase [Candidatus Aminicenantales bacterium]
MTEPLCPAWLSFTLTNVFRRMAHHPVRVLGPFLKEGDTALDIGCGPGYFTIPMARMVGDRGWVVAVDIQPAMLERTRRSAERAGVAGRVRLHLAAEDTLGLDLKADFALVFWMAHEVDRLERFFGEILAALKPEGRLLLVEPKVHVPKRRYLEIVAAAKKAGFTPHPTDPVRLSRAALLRPGTTSRSQG